MALKLFSEALGVTAKILRLRLTQKLNNYRGSDVRGDRQFELSRRMINTRLITIQRFTSYTSNDGDDRR